MGGSVGIEESERRLDIFKKEQPCGRCDIPPDFEKWVFEKENKKMKKIGEVIYFFFC